MRLSPTQQVMQRVTLPLVIVRSRHSLYPREPCINFAGSRLAGVVKSAFDPIRVAMNGCWVEAAAGALRDPLRKLGRASPNARALLPYNIRSPTYHLWHDLD